MGWCMTFENKHAMWQAESYRWPDHHPFYVKNDDFIEQFFLHILFTNLQIFYDVVKGPVFLSDYSVCTFLKDFETDVFVFVQYYSLS